MSNHNENSKDQIWHNDGHEIEIRINRADVEIISTKCPHQDGIAECKNREGECSVSLFIMRYGLDCNVGVCDAKTPIKICWTLIGNVDSLDECQVWFMPVDDHVFSAWLNSQSEI